ncbi:MAG: T9SS type A sorting domain-containing protein [Phaeodactylibacter sp.]|nr:T9SS type A sorting domain-containing protein [Phaeodactylibacter sp.]MCB9051032.1 T9SS type A sorting domain-containing protein [Lewinellaceae bacterium]
MKTALLRTLSFLLLALGITQAFGQHDCNASRHQEALNGNNIRTVILSGGDLFWDGNDARFQVPYQPNGAGTIFAQGLWLGAIDPAGNLKLAAQTYGRANGSTDYWAGPLNEEGSTDQAACMNWDRAFSVLRHQVEAHIADFADNGVIDNPIPEIMGWPGRGNPHFSDTYGFDLPDTPQGLAPFADTDGDGLYNPLAGDYPMIRNSAVIPSQITWVVFNDNGNLHTESNGAPLKVEVQLTSWAFDCSDNPQLNNTIFTSYKVINRGAEALDSLYLGLWTDFDLGCHTDDYIGTAPGLNTVFAYNSDNEDDANCQGIPSYGADPPVQAITVLNRELSFSMYYNNPSFGAPAGSPNSPQEFYNLLNSYWPDGTPLTFGGDGYDPDGINPPTSFIFPDDPSDPDGWSEITQNPEQLDRRTVTSIYLGELPPGAVAETDFAMAYFREEGADHLQNVTAMYEGITLLQSWYDSQFETACSPPNCDDDCVWAGDLNADGIANHCDLLAIGLGNSQSGTTRPAPYNWSPRSGQPWAGQQDNGANNKHLDADGDGQATYDDFYLSDEHYNLTHPGYQPPPATYRDGPELSLAPFGSTASFNDLRPGQEILFRVQLQAVPELYGLAFSLDFDTAYFDYLYSQSGGFDRENLRFSAPLDLILEDRAIPGQADFALLAPDQNSTIEGGTIFTFVRLKVKEEFPGVLPTNQSLIRFKNIKAVRGDGTDIEIGGTTVIATINGIMTDADEAAAADGLHLFPNPTTGQLELRFPGRQLDGVEVIDATGKRVWRRAGPLADAASVELPNLKGGIYFVRMRLEGKVVVRKVVVQR